MVFCDSSLMGPIKAQSLVSTSGLFSHLKGFLHSSSSPGSSSAIDPRNWYPPPPSSPCFGSPVGPPDAFFFIHLWLVPRLSFQAFLILLPTQKHPGLLQAHSSPEKWTFSRCTPLSFTPCPCLWGYLLLKGHVKIRHKGLFSPPRFPKC